MPRNYDEIRDGKDFTFVLRGETFKLKQASPEVLDQLDAIQTAFTADESTTYASVAKFAEDRLKLLLENGDTERWETLRTSVETPVAFWEITDISRWAFEQVTGVPTMQPSSSEDGPEKTVASSTGG